MIALEIILEIAVIILAFGTGMIIGELRGEIKALRIVKRMLENLEEAKEEHEKRSLQNNKKVW